MHEMPRAFVTFRLMGDGLDPGAVTEILGVQPTVAYRKGETYKVTRTGHPIVGRTGLWALSMRHGPHPDDLSAQALYLRRLLASPEKATAIRQLECAAAAEANLLVYCDGPIGDRLDDLPAELTDLAADLRADIELENGTGTRSTQTDRKVG